MTDLDDRLHHLRHDAVRPGPDPGEVRALAGRRRTRRHRRLALVTLPVLALLVAAAAVALSTDDDSQAVVTGTDPTTTEAPTTTTTTRPPTSLGTIDGLTIDVSPSTNLRDGQLVTVRIDGFRKLSSPIIILCAADVTAETATSDCDLTPLELGGTSDDDQEFSAEQQVAVRRVIEIPRRATPEHDQGGPFDCATEPVGCALVVGNNTLPATGVGVPVSFVDVAPLAPAMSVEPSSGLQDGQEVEVTATGLRPNSTFTIVSCGLTNDGVCDEITWPTAKSDAEGTLSTTVPVHAAIYGWKGRADCTEVPCGLRISTEGGDSETQAAIAFTDGVVAPVPQLALSPSGPYDDQQEITVTGTGFPPGFDMSSAIAQCPADKESAVENRCGYGSLSTGPVIVDEQGRFTNTIRLYARECQTEAGCVLGWVLNHGPTIAKVPLEFR